MRARATSPTPDMTTSWGLSFIPGVSSSKKRKSPALAAGMGASSRRLFSLLLNYFSYFLCSGLIVCNKGGVAIVAGCIRKRLSWTRKRSVLS
jgi:hypothetical protein